jgi:hypothetical protein
MDHLIVVRSKIYQGTSAEWWAVKTDRNHARMTVSVQHGRDTLNRVVASIASIFFAGAAAFAQPAPKVPACSQSMIVGTFNQLAVNPLQGNLGFACPISIGANGTLAPGDCILSASQSIIAPVSGTLTIDRTCHVVGSITYTLKNAMGVTLPVQLSVSAWRSADGSRLSGHVTVNLTCGSAPCLNNYISPFELVASQ